MTVYIEAIGKFPSDDWSCSAYLGFRANSADIKLFENISEVPLNRNTLLVASIENTHQWMTDMGWTIPKSITLPERLSSTWWTDRNISKMTLGEALAKTDYPYFIKSYELKKFLPGVIEKEDDKKWFRVDVLDNKIPVLVSDVIDFASEYRVYVIDGKIQGVCWYNGSMKYYPDYNVIEDMVRQFSDAPKFYSLDVGVVLKGKNLAFTYLVECNDGYSLGNYGLSPKLYTRGIVARWRELLDQNPVKL